MANKFRLQHLSDRLDTIPRSIIDTMYKPSKCQGAKIIKYFIQQLKTFVFCIVRKLIITQ